MKTDNGQRKTLREHLEACARHYCFDALFYAGGNKSLAARMLGIHRNTLNKIISRGTRAASTR